MNGDLRIGIGIDAHPFGADRPLILGGVRVRDENGLSGHSDADVLTHAVIDALLGAAGLEDIGHYFPDSDPALKGAFSLDLLAKVRTLVEDRGWEVVNVDAVVVCDQPRISSHRDRIRACLAAVLGIEPDCVGVRGKSTEGMGLSGAEGVRVDAVALLRRRGEPIEPA